MTNTTRTIDTNALTIIGAKQREAGETSRDLAEKFMAAILAGKLELADSLLDTIEAACDAHKGNKGTNFAFSYAAIAHCRDTLIELASHADAIGSDTWNKAYDSLTNQIVRLSGFMPSNISNGGSDKNVPLSDLMRGLKSVARATARTPLAWIPDEKSRATLVAARKAEQDRLDRKAQRENDKLQPPTQPAPAATTDKPARKARASRKATPATAS